MERGETLAEDLVLWKKLFRTIEMIRNYNVRSCRIKRSGKDLSMTQMQIIGCVVFSPEQKVRVRDISDELGLTPGAVSQQVEKLVQMDFLDRKADEHDRRAVCITLSENGRELYSDVEVFYSTLFDKIFSGIPKEEFNVFSHILDVMQIRVEEEKNKFLKNNKKEESK